ncbi:MAG TPA: hypothetical protein ENK31_07105 [Nannocystis exedens]|nr:hypothetical protein [Nannocystis exedens]
MTGTVTTEVDGFFRTEAGEEVARLRIKDTERSVTTTKQGSHENKKEGQSTSLFSTTGSYLVSTKGESTEFDTGNSTTFVKINVDWKKGARAAAPKPQVQVQSISDPCDPDYVGTEECVPETQVQSISDPCDPDYVGTEECVPASDPPAEAAPAS